MPVELTEFERFVTPRGGGGNRKYSWDEWLDGVVREFEYGVDFDGSISSFVSSAQRAAAQRGLWLRASRDKRQGKVRLQSGAQPFETSRKRGEQ